MATEFRPPDRSNFVRPERTKRLGSRQKRQRRTRDEDYAELKAIYLDENPQCAVCFTDACDIHHIVGGVAGRARSLLNTNTWLGLCRPCHEELQGESVLKQFQIKLNEIARTIERLRK